MRSKSYDFSVQTQVEKHYIHKDSEFYRVYIDMMEKVTRLYNICVGIQLSEAKKAEDNSIKNNLSTIKYKVLSAQNLDYKIKTDNRLSLYYKELPANTAQIVTQEVTGLFKSSITKYKNLKNNKGKEASFPKRRRYNTCSVFSIVDKGFRQEGNRLEVILGRLESENHKRLSIRVHAHKRPDFVSYQQLKFKKYKDSIIVYVIYRIRCKEKRAESRYISIDLGIKNYVCITNNVGLRPILISGKELISKLKKSQHKLEYLQSCLSKSSISKKYTKQMESIVQNIKNYQDNYEHQVSNYIIKYCLKHDIDTIVVGYNRGWKCGSSLRTDINKYFQKVSFSSLIFKLLYKVNREGINFHEVEESYTSGTSFLNLEYPDESNYDSSRRTHRGLFETKVKIPGIRKHKKCCLNADVNASYQILKKHISSVYTTQQEVLICRYQPIGIKDLRIVI